MSFLVFEVDACNLFVVVVVVQFAADGISLDSVYDSLSCNVLVVPGFDIDAVWILNRYLIEEVGHHLELFHINVV